jgi:phosphoglycolate phosphatase
MLRTNRPIPAERIRLLIFDLDGTLVDSRLDLANSVNATLRHFERPELPCDLIASYIGDGAPMLVRLALGDPDDTRLVDDALAFFLAYYREHKLDHTTVYAGVKESLTAIRCSRNGPGSPASPPLAGRGGSGGRALERTFAVLSNKPVHPSRAIVQALGLAEFFVQVYGGNSFPTKKPDPLGARTLLQEAGVTPEEAMIIGDSDIDVLTGRNAGLWTCGVTYGFAPHSLESAPPDALLDSPSELVELFGLTTEAWRH